MLKLSVCLVWPPLGRYGLPANEPADQPVEQPTSQPAADQTGKSTGLHNSGGQTRQTKIKNDQMCGSAVVVLFWLFVIDFFY